ncbi:MAG: hypothetical protein JXQ29_12450 [Planctomycetes bacterium]|nr:hypothetical protein [Planctomycetota bacterium]
MSTRERRPEPPRPPGGTDGSEEGGLDALRHAGSDLLAAADRAIDAALSRDSASFLRQSRQAGGE